MPRTGARFRNRDSGSTIHLLFFVFAFLVFVTCLLGLGAGLRLCIVHLELLQLGLSQGSHPVGRASGPGDEICNLSSANQRRNDTSSDNEGKDESISRIPTWSPASSRGSRICVVQEGECKELSDQSDFSGEQKGRPCNGCGNNPDEVSWVALVSTKASPFETPMDGTQEGDNLGGVVSFSN